MHAQRISTELGNASNWSGKLRHYATRWAELALYATIDMQLTRLVGSQGIILVMGFNCKDEEAALVKVASFAKANNGFWWFCNSHMSPKVECDLFVERYPSNPLPYTST